MRTISPALFTSDGRLRQHDAWALYVAYCPMGGEETLVKIGVSTTPLQRIYSVHCGSPFNVQVAQWQYVGTKSQALSAERSILAKLVARKTRGEWVRLKMTEPADKELLHASLRHGICKATGRSPVWKKTTIAEIKASLDIDWHKMRA